MNQDKLNTILRHVIDVAPDFKVTDRYNRVNVNIPFETLDLKGVQENRYSFDLEITTYRGEVRSLSTPVLSTMLLWMAEDYESGFYETITSNRDKDPELLKECHKRYKFMVSMCPCESCDLSHSMFIYDREYWGFNWGEHSDEINAKYFGRYHSNGEPINCIKTLGQRKRDAHEKLIKELDNLKIRCLEALNNS